MVHREAPPKTASAKRSGVRATAAPRFCGLRSSPANLGVSLIRRFVIHALLLVHAVFLATDDPGTLSLTGIFAEEPLVGVWLIDSSTTSSVRSTSTSSTR